MIPLSLDREPRGFYVIFKGTDPGTCVINSMNSLNKTVTGFAAKLPGLAISYPEYYVVPFTRYTPQVKLAHEGQLTSPCRGLKKTGTIVQAVRYDPHLEKTGGQYAAHLYPNGSIFNSKDTQNLPFPDLKALNAYLKELQAVK